MRQERWRHCQLKLDFGVAGGRGEEAGEVFVSVSLSSKKILIFATSQFCDILLKIIQSADSRIFSAIAHLCVVVGCYEAA